MPSTARAAVYPLLMLAAVVTLTTCAGANTTPRTPTHGHILPTADLSGRKLLTIDKIHDAISNVVQAKVDAVQDLLNSNKVNLVNNPAPATSATAGAFAAVQATAVAPPPPTQPTSASAFAAASATATAPTPNLPKPPVPAPCKTVYQTAQSVPELSTLVALVQAAGLVSELNDTNLVATVFAPTNAAINAAIAALGTSQADVLRNRELLRQARALCCCVSSPTTTTRSNRVGTDPPDTYCPRSRTAVNRPQGQPSAARTVWRIPHHRPRCWWLGCCQSTWLQCQGHSSQH